MTSPPPKHDMLLAWFEPFKSCVVAFSAGVDSAVAAKAAQLALGNSALALTAVSPSLAEGELEQAEAVARQIGIQHELIQTEEMQDSRYSENPTNRCFYCKSELYSRIATHVRTREFDVVVNGANHDDLGDYRPGMQAAREQAVRMPLAECGITKDEVRELARFWELPVWDKPATPCLSSRIAYGEEVTVPKLRMIDRGEQWLRERGFVPCRVRLHTGGLARVEVPAEQILRLCEAPLRDELNLHFRELGFQFVTVDAGGFQSGSLNRLVQLDGH